MTAAASLLTILARFEKEIVKLAYRFSEPKGKYTFDDFLKYENSMSAKRNIFKDVRFSAKNDKQCISF